MIYSSLLSFCARPLRNAYATKSVQLEAVLFFLVKRGPSSVYHVPQPAGLFDEAIVPEWPEVLKQTACLPSPRTYIIQCGNVQSRPMNHIICEYYTHGHRRNAHTASCIIEKNNCDNIVTRSYDFFSVGRNWLQKALLS